MKFMEIIKELLLGLSIVVILPAVTHWGVLAFLPAEAIQVNSALDTPMVKDTSAKAIQAGNKKKRVKFLTHMLVGIFTIIIGLCTSVQSLSIGFIGGGIVNLVMGIQNSLDSAMLTFICLLALFILLLTAMIIAKNKKTT